MPAFPIPMIPRTALAMMLFAIAQSAFAQNSTTPPTPTRGADSTTRAGIKSQHDPCGMAAPFRPGTRRMGFGEGAEQAIGLDLSAELVPLGMLALDQSQRTRINAIQRGLCVKHSDLAARIAESRTELRQLYAAGQRDAGAIDQQYEKLFTLQRQAIEADVDALERIKSELTTEQRAALEKFPRSPAGIAPSGEPAHRAGDRKGTTP